MGSARPRIARRHRFVRWTPIVAAVAIFALTLAAPQPAQPQPHGAGPAPTGADSAAAREIYQRDCAECHGGDGLGTSHAPPLVGVGTAYVDYVLSTGRMPVDEPDDPIERGPASYPRPVRLAIAEYVDGLSPDGVGGPDVPDVDLSDADVANGGVLYRSNCAACHQSIGVGGALVNRAAPSVRDATDVEVVEAIRVGPFEMPAFGSSAMSDEEVDDVAAYVTEVLQEPENRGGLSIWHLGPVPEGAVAIILGLGALVLLSLWIEGRVPRSEEDVDEHGDATTGGET